MPETITLADIAAQFVKLNKSFEQFHVKIFSVVTPNLPQFEEFVRALKLPTGCIPTRHPFNVLVGDLSSVVTVQSTMVPSIKEGTLVMNSFVSDAKLPNCPYVAIVAPESKIGGGAITAINFARAFLCLNFGSLVHYTLVAEFDFDASGKASFGGPVFRLPMFADLARFPDVSIANEIAARLALQMDPYREKLQRACDFMSSALNQKDEAFRFAAYWIALEVLVGTGGAIQDALAKAYGENRQFVDDSLCFKELAQMRIQLVHFGKFRTLLSYQERLLQIYFWEIVRSQIGLACRKLAVALVNSGQVAEEREHQKKIQPDAVVVAGSAEELR